MTEKKCALRRGYLALALGAAIATAAAGIALAQGAAPSGASAPASGAVAAGAKLWNFDHDRAYQPPGNWTVSGPWQVMLDTQAPSEPNTLTLPGYGLPQTHHVRLWLDSFLHNTYLLAVPNDQTEYSDFSYEASFKPWGGAFGSFAGLAFRYTDPQNYYVLVAACPKDYLGLYRMSGGQLTEIKQVPATLARGNWYNFKIDARGGHFIAYLDGHRMFQADDSTIAKGRVGVWSQNDSRVSFDSIRLTPAASGS